MTDQEFCYWKAGMLQAAKIMEERFRALPEAQAIRTQVELANELVCAIGRCDSETSEILRRPDVVAGKAPAWLVALGVADWTAERQEIEKDLRRTISSAS